VIGGVRIAHDEITLDYPVETTASIRSIPAHDGRVDS
jgi:hypothetical protein